MSRSILLFILLISFVQAQLNGEFWWLNSKLNDLKKVKQPPPPVIDEKDFENYERSARILFRDDDFFVPKIVTEKQKLKAYYDHNENKIVFPFNEIRVPKDVEVFTSKPKDDMDIAESNEKLIENNDLLVFHYPKTNKIVSNSLDMTSTESSITTPIEITSKETNAGPVSSNSIIFNTDRYPMANSNKKSQNICTYTKREECLMTMNGFVYEYARRVPPSSDGEPLVCCVLPIQSVTKRNDLSNLIYFPSLAKNRLKRSNTEENIALKQRDFLLRTKFSTQGQKFKPVTTTQSKIVTQSDDDYEDPYWNVKNSKFHSPRKPNVDHKYDYYNEDYEDYPVEIPKPGLIGLYSDHNSSPSSLVPTSDGKGISYGGNNDYEDIDDDYSSIGYSTIDPRKGNNRQKIKPLKLSTTTDEATYNAQSQTINFQANPDFHVLQGFKLLNLFRNTSTVYKKDAQKTTSALDDGEEVLTGRPIESDEIDDDDVNKQLFSRCGRASNKSNDRDKQIGEATSGSHPWLAMVVLTKRRHNLLCYATLVHPRAAITVADCVHGTAPGDISVIAGLWDLNDRVSAKNRVAIVHVHPRFKAGEVDNNIAVLYWMRPIKLNSNIQPACLGEPEIGDDCKFFGWGRLGEAIQPRSRWQRASIRSCQGINMRQKPAIEAFCATTARGVVTGMGGPLICDDNGYNTIVGVVVSRNSDYVLSPVQEWTLKASQIINVSNLQDKCCIRIYRQHPEIP